MQIIEIKEIENSAYSGVLVEIDSSPKKMVNQNSDGNENKEEEKT